MFQNSLMKNTESLLPKNVRSFKKNNDYWRDEGLQIYKSETYSWRHFNKKSFASTDRCSGIGGWDLVVPMWKRAATWKRNLFLDCKLVKNNMHHPIYYSQFSYTLIELKKKSANGIKFVPPDTVGSMEVSLWPSQSQYSQRSIYQQN